jgi:hypothetical protein
MNSVTIASLAYIATQVRRAITLLYQDAFDARPKVRFALSSSSVFSRTDTTTDSETFYHSLLDLLEDPEEVKEVDELLTWWNRYFLSSFTMSLRLIINIATYAAKFFPPLLLPRELSVLIAPYPRSDNDALPSNKLQIPMLPPHSYFNISIHLY